VSHTQFLLTEAKIARGASTPGYAMLVPSSREPRLRTVGNRFVFCFPVGARVVVPDYAGICTQLLFSSN